MPSPVAHSLLGYMVSQATAGADGEPQWWRVGLYIVAANAPDLDFIPGFLVGDPNRFHHGVSHSIGFAILFAGVFSVGLALLKQEVIRKNFFTFFCLYASHLGLDYLSLDLRAPYGLPALWPLSDAFYTAPFAFLLDIRRASSFDEFIPSLFSWHNLAAVGVELLVLLPCIILLRLCHKIKPFKA